MNEAPKDIKVKRKARVLEVTWQDGELTSYPLRFLRQQCRCAACVHEFTGQQLLDPETVPENIGAANLALVGRYAVQIAFSDDHSTGIYTWRYLQRLKNELAQ